MPEEDREAAAINGNVVSESEVENPDSYLEANSDTPERTTLLHQKIAYIRRKARRDRAKAIAERNFLARKRSKKVHGIVDKFPGIGKEIERFVEERSVGADRWRRTGVLTFDGNKAVSKKVTYERIQKHLECVYGRKFGYGTVVQLCVARNRRRLSAKRYKGVAKVTTRRARKGFSLRYNPDKHWSSSLYKGLNFLEYSDGTAILNMNRDDAAGFRLDTLATHRLHRSPMVQGTEVLATYTDYVNRYPSVLQTTCYNFTATETTGQQCAGVVKGVGLENERGFPQLQFRKQGPPGLVRNNGNSCSRVELHLQFLPVDQNCHFDWLRQAVMQFVQAVFFATAHFRVRCSGVNCFLNLVCFALVLLRKSVLTCRYSLRRRWLLELHSRPAYWRYVAFLPAVMTGRIFEFAVCR